MIENTTREMQGLIADLMHSEEQLNNQILHMTANENRLSKVVQQLLSTPLSNRYHLGTSIDYNYNKVVKKPNLIFRGLPDLYQLESLAHKKLSKNLGGQVTDSRILSGIHAMICSISSLTEVGDVILSICPEGGGHFATSNLISTLGRKSVLIDYDRKDLTISLSHLKKLKKTYCVKAVFLDDSAPLYPLPLKEIRDILGDKVIIIYDASHTLGLIFGGCFLNPIQDGCNIIQGNTHKTFPGPQKALLHFADKEIAGRSIQTIGNILVSSQHTHHSLALYATILEMDIYAKDYAKAVISNAKTLSEALATEGFKVLTNGKSYTETHQVLFNLPAYSSNYEICEKLLNCNISVNAKNVYEQDLIRIGVQELTRIGMKADEMKEIASIIKIVLVEGQTEIATSMVKELISSFQEVHYSFDKGNP